MLGYFALWTMVITCHVCDRVFRREMDRKTHFLAQHANLNTPTVSVTFYTNLVRQSVVCPLECGFVSKHVLSPIGIFRHFNNIHDHYAEHELVVNFCCQTCDNLFMDPSEVEDHKQSHVEALMASNAHESTPTTPVESTAADQQSSSPVALPTIASQPQPSVDGLVLPSRASPSRSPDFVLSSPIQSQATPEYLSPSPPADLPESLPPASPASSCPEDLLCPDDLQSSPIISQSPPEYLTPRTPVDQIIVNFLREADISSSYPMSSTSPIACSTSTITTSASSAARHQSPPPRTSYPTVRISARHYLPNVFTPVRNSTPPSTTRPVASDFWVDSPSSVPEPAVVPADISIFENLDEDSVLPESPTAELPPFPDAFHRSDPPPSDTPDPPDPPDPPEDPNQPLLNNPIPDNPDPNANQRSEFATTWFNRFPDLLDFNEFATTCEEFAAAVVTEGKRLATETFHRTRGNPPPRRPMNRHPTPNRRPLVFNARDASRL